MQSHNEENALIRVDDLVIETGTHLLRRGDEVIELPQLSYRLLRALMTAAPNLLTYDELMDQVWEGRVVSPETITQRVKLLRQALGDDAQEPRYIGLVRGSGYRLLATVTPFLEDNGAGDESVSSRWRLPAALAALLLALVALFLGRSPDIWKGDVGQEPSQPGEVRIAVLPFRNLVNDPADRYIIEGLGDELRDQLGRSTGLMVAARASSVVFRDEELEATEIAERLGVDFLVEGSVSREQSQMRITVEIIDGQTGFQSWSRIFSLHSTGLLSVQHQIATEVLGELSPVAVADASPAQPVTRDVSAHELLLLARHYDQQVREELIVDQGLLLKAVELYRDATEADPESAIAHSRLGAALLYLGDVTSAEPAIFESLRLDPDHAHGQYTLGLYYWTRRLPGAGAAFQRAIDLNPNDPDAQAAYAKWIWHQADSASPEAHFRQALALDPMSHLRYLDLGNFLGHTGRTQAAVEVAEEVERRFDDARGAMVQARIYELTGDFGRAIGWAMQARDLRPNDEEVRWLLAELYARIGDHEMALKFEPEPGVGQLFWQRRYEDLIPLAEDVLIERPFETLNTYTLARAYLAQGEYELAAGVLERAGLPERALNETRRSTDEEAAMALADAWMNMGQQTRALELAAWLVDFFQSLNDTGATDASWARTQMACGQALLGRSDEAITSVELAVNSPGLAWLPLLRDMPCLNSLAGEPRFDAALEQLESRMAEQRRRVPETLTAMGIDAPEFTLQDQ